MSSGVRPTPSNYTFRTRVPNFSSCRTYDDRTGNFNCTDNPYVFSLSSNVTGEIGVHFIGIRLALDKGTRNSRIKRNRLMKSCKDSNGRQKRSCVGVKDPPTDPPPTPEIKVPQYDQRTDVNYTMSVTMRSCLYWSETRQAWTSEGCKVWDLEAMLVQFCREKQGDLEMKLGRAEIIFLNLRWLENQSIKVITSSVLWYLSSYIAGKMTRY